MPFNEFERSPRTASLPYKPLDFQVRVDYIGLANKCSGIRNGTMYYKNQIYSGDCLDVLKTFPDESVDLIFTSPPYADQRRKTYGGVSPDEYVGWFLPRAEQFQRVLKPTGTFILNI